LAQVIKNWAKQRQSEESQSDKENWLKNRQHYFFVQTKAKRSKVQKFKKDTVILFALEQRQSEKVLAQDCGSNM